MKQTFGALSAAELVLVYIRNMTKLLSSLFELRLISDKKKYKHDPNFIVKLEWS